MTIPAQKLKTFVKFIIYYFIDVFIRPSKKIIDNSLLLIRLDAIGDFVIFRNFIEELNHSEKYANYKITLLGNSVWKNVAEEFDCDFVDSFIWLDRERFSKNLLYRYKKLKEITSNGYEVVLSPVFSREFFYGDNIVKLITGKQKIGFTGDLSNINDWQKHMSDRYYDKLFNADGKLIFEFYRNKEFFEKLLGVNLDIDKPHLKLSQDQLNFKLPEKYAIIFIGASSDSRKWSAKNFAKVGMHLKQKHGYEIVLCGAPKESADALLFNRSFKGEFFDLVGKTSLVDLFYVINNANLMLSNETSAPHIAVALDMKSVFVVSNGNHYGRFTPYPKEITQDCHAVYPNEIKFNDFEKNKNNYGLGTNLDINQISPKSIIKKIDMKLS